MKFITVTPRYFGRGDTTRYVVDCICRIDARSDRDYQYQINIETGEQKELVIDSHWTDIVNHWGKVLQVKETVSEIEASIKEREEE